MEFLRNLGYKANTFEGKRATLTCWLTHTKIVASKAAKTTTSELISFCNNITKAKTIETGKVELETATTGIT